MADVQAAEQPKTKPKAKRRRSSPRRTTPPAPAHTHLSRSVTRGGRLFAFSLTCLAVTIGIEYLATVTSREGGTIEEMLDYLALGFNASYRGGFGIAFHSLGFDLCAFRFITLRELLTNKPAPWRYPGEWEPIDSDLVRAAMILGWMLTLAVTIYSFINMAT